MSRTNLEGRGDLRILQCKVLHIYDLFVVLMDYRLKSCALDRFDRWGAHARSRDRGGRAVEKS